MYAMSLQLPENCGPVQKCRIPLTTGPGPKGVVSAIAVVMPESRTLDRAASLVEMNIL